MATYIVQSTWKAWFVRSLRHGGTRSSGRDPSLRIMISIVIMVVNMVITIMMKAKTVPLLLNLLMKSVDQSCSDESNFHKEGWWIAQLPPYCPSIVFSNASPSSTILTLLGRRSQSYYIRGAPKNVTLLFDCADLLSSLILMLQCVLRSALQILIQLSLCKEELRAFLNH